MIRLSGNRRFRVLQRTFRKPLLVLQVEEVGTVPEYCAGRIDMQDVRRWRDATVEDVSFGSIEAGGK